MQKLRWICCCWLPNMRLSFPQTPNYLKINLHKNTTVSSCAVQATPCRVDENQSSKKLSTKTHDPKTIPLQILANLPCRQQQQEVWLNKTCNFNFSVAANQPGANSSPNVVFNCVTSTKPCSKVGDSKSDTQCKSRKSEKEIYEKRCPPPAEWGMYEFWSKNWSLTT